jgi:hypothetical protein
MPTVTHVRASAKQEGASAKQEAGTIQTSPAERSLAKGLSKANHNPYGPH